MEFQARFQDCEVTERAWELQYDCWKCGACCKAVRCPLLVDNRCSIYPDRPDICRVGYSFDPDRMTVGEYLEATFNACKTLEAAMTYRFGQFSLNNLETCHPDLILLMTTALEAPECPVDFTVTEGHRTRARQNQLQEEGRSQLSWPNSRHNTLPSMAADVSPWIDGAVSWEPDDYKPLAAHIKATWNRLELEGKLSGLHNLKWGGDWRNFVDMPHWQLDLK